MHNDKPSPQQEEATNGQEEEGRQGEEEGRKSYKWPPTECSAVTRQAPIVRRPDGCPTPPYTPPRTGRKITPIPRAKVESVAPSPVSPTAIASSSEETKCAAVTETAAAHVVPTADIHSVVAPPPEMASKNENAAITKDLDEHRPVEEVETIACNSENLPIGKKKEEGELVLAEFNPRDLTDMGNATRLRDRIVGKFNFVPALKRWVKYIAGRWIVDSGSGIKMAAKGAVRAMYAEAAEIDNAKEREAFLAHAKRSQNANYLANMVEVAQSELAVEMDRFDKKPWFLNLQNLTFDLQTRNGWDHDPQHFLMKMAGTAYDETASCPTWLAFLDKITGGDPELVAYLQRIVGYTLTGMTSERCLFVLQGTGANGKSTFLNVLTELLGDYAVSTPIESLMTKSSSGVPNDIARLRGARLVTASEGEMDQKLAEALVKRLTGQDRITARFLRCEFFEFLPEFKIFLATNHAPLIRGGDEGIWDRIRLIPFAVRIPESKRDPQLQDKLRAELPGILNWALQGCAEWQEKGLMTPECVRRATKEYRAEMDVLGRFLDETCEHVPGDKVSSRTLYDHYRRWTSENGERSESQKLLGTRLKERGIQSRKIQGYPHWLDIRIRA